MTEINLKQAIRARSSVKSRLRGIQQKNIHFRYCEIESRMALHDVSGAFDQEINEISQIYSNMLSRLENAKVTF